jgi:hypothetical protein
LGTRVGDGGIEFCDGMGTERGLICHEVVDGTKLSDKPVLCDFGVHVDDMGWCRLGGVVGTGWGTSVDLQVALFLRCVSDVRMAYHT